MADVVVNAVVLRRRDAGESDRRLTVLTRELGKIDIVAKGARKSGSRLAGSSDPLTCSKLSLASGKRNLYVTQSQPLGSYRGLRADYERLALALALAELYGAVLPFEQESPEAYDLLLTSLMAIEAHSKPAVAAAWSQVQLMELEGFLPQFDRCAVTGEALAGAAPSVSPAAGGYVSVQAQTDLYDLARTTKEILIGLSKLPGLSEPPTNLKFVEESLALLLHFWRHIADMALPANEAWLNDMKLSRANPSTIEP